MSLIATSDRSAPVIAWNQIEVAAVPEIVWSILTDFGRWPDWMPDVNSMAVSGEVAKGTQFRWRAGSFTINSTIQQVERPRLIAWTGKMLGIDAVHVWRLEPHNGRTIVRTEESWSGLAPRIFKGSLQKTLQDSLDSGLRALKEKAERLQSENAAGVA